MILALSGRRIDSPDMTSPIFPYANVELVQGRIRRLFLDQHVTVLVCSAACGADLVALETARGLGIRRRIILPFGPIQFRKSSVIDRPGNWGPIFDRAIAEVTAEGDLVSLQSDSDGDESYLQANHAILDESLLLAASSGDRAGAALIWDGVSRGNNDITESFGKTASVFGLVVFEVSTL
jgi:hypothetical protein